MELASTTHLQIEYETKCIYLNNDKTSWITISELPIYLKNYAHNNFDSLFDLHPQDKGKVLVFNKDRENPEWNEINCFRWHKSYLNTPSFNKNSYKSYMFSGWDTSSNNENVPNTFIPFYDFIKNVDQRYNQMVINWYENSDDYIPLHSDCEYSMIDNHDITILNLNKSDNDELCRTLTIIPKETTTDYISDKYEIKLTHGMIICMGGNMQNEFSHGVDKCVNDYTTPRISISFRQY